MTPDDIQKAIEQSRERIDKAMSVYYRSWWQTPSGMVSKKRLKAERDASLTAIEQHERLLRLVGAAALPCYGLWGEDGITCDDWNERDATAEFCPSCQARQPALSGEAAGGQ